MAFTLKASRC